MRETGSSVSAFIAAVERRTGALHAFSVGACPGCDPCGLPKGATDAQREAAEESHFSWRACDSCGSTFGGDRHPAHCLTAPPGHPEAELCHLAVCVDCLLFHANGDEPDSWEAHP